MPKDTREEDPSRFPPTRWSLVARAREGDDPKGLEALEELLAAYRPVLRLYLIRSLRLPPEQADDMVQDFMAQRILRDRLLDRADRARGRFRSFLLKCFLNFVRGEQRKQRAAKRGPPPSRMVNLDEHAGEIPDPLSGRKDFNALWARQVISATLERMERECAGKRRKDIWIIFEQRVLNPIFSGDAPRAYEELVAELGLKSPLHASNLLITAKRSFQRALEAVVRETVSSEGEVAAELSELKRALAGAAAQH